MGEYRTRDVSLATFFVYSGHQLKGYQTVRNGGRTEGEWVFDMTQEDADNLKVDYVNSEFGKFEGIRRSLTKQKYR